jgi:hypothetical protein
MDEGKIGLNEGIIVAAIAVIPAFGYWIAYLYDLGYCTFFDIPYYYINVSIIQTITAIIAVINIIGIVFLLGEPFYYIFMSLPNQLQTPIRAIFLSITMMIGASIVYKLSWKSTIIVIGIMAGSIILCEFVLPLLFYRKIKGYLAKIDKHNKNQDWDKSIFGSIRKKLGYNLYACFTWGLIISLLSFYTGGIKAKRMTDFIVLDEASDMVVLKVHDGYFLAADVDRSEKKIYPKYKHISKENGGRKFKFERVGPLMPKGLNTEKEGDGGDGVKRRILKK